MTKYKIIYLFEVVEHLSKGEVYILDREETLVYVASTMTGGLLAKIVNAKNADNRFEAWVEEAIPQLEGDNE